MKMKLDRNTLVLVLFLILVVTVTDYRATDIFGIMATMILSVALIINLIALYMRGRDK